MFVDKTLHEDHNFFQYRLIERSDFQGSGSVTCSSPLRGFPQSHTHGIRQGSDLSLAHTLQGNGKRNRGSQAPFPQNGSHFQAFYFQAIQPTFCLLIVVADFLIFELLFNAIK